MEHLLQGNIDLGPQSVDEDEDIEANRIQRYIQPEQPINCAELVRIIEHDHLDSVDDSEAPPSQSSHGDDSKNWKKKTHSIRIRLVSKIYLEHVEIKHTAWRCQTP